MSVQRKKMAKGSQNLLGDLREQQRIRPQSLLCNLLFGLQMKSCTVVNSVSSMKSRFRICNMLITSLWTTVSQDGMDFQRMSIKQYT